MLPKLSQTCSTTVLKLNHGLARLGPFRLSVSPARANFASQCRLNNHCLHVNSSHWGARASLLSYASYHKALNKSQLWDCIPLSLRFRIRSSKLQRRGVTVTSYSTATPFNVNQVHGNVAQDTLIFSHKNENFFKFLSIFGVVQMLMWGYLSLFSVQELRAGPVIKKDTSDLPWWQKVLYTEGRYKNAISLLCFTLGASILFITLTYPRRAIRKLWLLKGGKDVEITTYSWFGQTYSFKTSVEHINCIQSRTGTGSQVPFKVKDKHFFYLLDKQGSFHNPELFDFVIGLKRNLQ